MRIVVALLVLTVLISFYVISWRLNKKQKLPEGMEESLKSCDACDNSGCGLHPDQRGSEDV